ncbi:hypothetical protein [Microbulbifer yueqingensis]|uniref:Uncharacterized protein n=1 Tax=Microbulbifer yueqingensis TaxID=658219 RepID=A0A1G8XYU8_9GAMM|nr:hypothetical protein [Microbulbifer yueqingensis]SDJ95055.1 hypothetical protein SAMN05216212_1271 [Microbulbifer yueqingensis]
MKKIVVDPSGSELPTIKVVPRQGKARKWEMFDDEGTLEGIDADFRSKCRVRDGGGLLKLQFQLAEEGWEWSDIARGVNRIPGIEFCSGSAGKPGRPVEEKYLSEFISYVDAKDPSILTVILGPKYAGNKRYYDFCWVAKLHGSEHKSMDPPIVIDPPEPN